MPSIKSSGSRGVIFKCVCLAAFLSTSAMAEDFSADVVIYKASPGGITSAIAAARMGAKVILVEPTAYVGGITAQGALGASDVANYSTIGGLSREFFRRTGDYYKNTYGSDSRQLKESLIGTLEGGQVEPRVAEEVYERWLKEEPNIRVVREAPLEKVEKKDGRITSITCLPPHGESLRISGSEFIDASYTGDMMAKAGVSYLLGSEGWEQFGESMARDKAGPQIQAFNYRIPLTRDPANRRPIPKPKDYDPAKYASVVAYASKAPYASPQRLFQYHLPNAKLDSNFSDMPEFNWGYPEAGAEERARQEAIQRNYSLGFLYFIQHDPRLPEGVRKANLEWGLSKDEFADNGNFPREIYVREARRLNGEYVMRQQDAQVSRRKEDSIAVGSISLDCHATQHPDTDLPKRAPALSANGGIMAPVRPYDIAYRSIVPKPGECTNLFVPVCLGATHVAWSSIRMEPVFMMTGEAAGIAAKIAIDKNLAVQQVPVAELEDALTKRGGIIHAYVEPVPEFDWEPKNPQPGEKVQFFAKPIPGSNPVEKYLWNFDGGDKVGSTEKDPVTSFSAKKGTLVTLVVTDSDGRNSNPIYKTVPVGTSEGDHQLNSDDPTVKGRSERSTGAQPYYGNGFGLDMGFDKGHIFKKYEFQPAISGTYAIYVSSAPAANRSKNTLVEVEQGGKKESARVDQSRSDPIFGWVHVGDVALSKQHPSSVTIRNDGTEGVVIYDAVRWIWRGPVSSSPARRDKQSANFNADAFRSLRASGSRE